jgi:hypothetical protein
MNGAIENPLRHGRIPNWANSPAPTGAVIAELVPAIHAVMPQITLRTFWSFLCNGL